MRAVLPTHEGDVERDGATLHYEVYERDAPTILLVPTWEIVHSRHWKMQIPFLSRHYRVVTYDAAGTGRSSRPTDAARFTQSHRMDDALAVLDATGTDRALAVGFSMGAELVMTLQAYAPDLIVGTVAIAASHPWRIEPRERVSGGAPYDPATNPTPEGWAKFDFDYWQRDWRDFLEFFMAQVASDPHSTKGVEDLVEWGLDQHPSAVAAAVGDGHMDKDGDQWRALLAASTIPCLLIHGTGDRITDYRSSELAHAAMPASELHLHPDVSHAPQSRYPVRTNHEIKAFADRVFGIAPLDVAVHVAPAASPRVLYLSSPIGLGHARRDLAIAQELRALHPDATIDWLAQDPVTRVLAASGERLHPASSALAHESAHIESESGEHNLAVFQTLRTMDEILAHNFHVFDEVVAGERYDLVIADESWDVDYHLFENPGLKKAALAWMTDFVGYLPMPSRGAREAAVTADYNAEMIEHVARHPSMRDAAVFVGSPDDIVDGTFGPGLPGIREWTEGNYDFSGYITGFDPRALGTKEELRADLGYREDERVCIVAVGGSGVGGALIRRVVAGADAARRAVPGLRMIVVTGPRLDPESMPQAPGVEYRAYVPDLHRHLAACDLAIVQGGLTTTMELTAAKVPFIYVPLREHFEQNFHVRARLDRYRAGRCMEFDELTPDALAEAISQEVGRDVDFRDVETDGAANAARRLAALL
ncbi:alpha/beta fold hydrolase [Demequina sp.]|uniref:alpha/beta fold hydrolase n=1 Tax=Demequina sp. TaxID=2050685 RepID=UPI0025DE5856|nr:alpha/beta fold hydrolase [Demequina sp.]